MKPQKTPFAVAAILLLASTVSHAQCPASFASQNISGSTVQFTAQPAPANGAVSYYWLFGYSSQSSVAVGSNTMVHSFPGNGVYTVTVHYSDSVSSTPCFSSATNTVLVNTSTCNDSISFTWTPAANGKVIFYGNSFNNLSYAYSWDFGDGSQGSGFSPVHTYTSGGVYTVTLTANTSPVAVCSYTAAKVLTVNIVPCPIAASFSYATAGNQATLSSTSSGTTATSFYAWQFGDGHTAYGNPVVHTYSNNGSYNARLIVQDSSAVFCDDTVQQTVSITNGSCLLNLSFIVQKDSVQPLTWYIYPNVAGNITSVQWNWGDGSTSNLLYASHTFSAAGTYSICLSATAACGATSVTCVQSSIYRTAGSEVISVIVKEPVTGMREPDYAQLPLKVIPNPSSGTFTLRLPEQTAVSEIVIVDPLGRAVWKSDRIYETVDPVIISAEDLPPGTYLVTVSSGDARWQARVLVVR